MDKVNKMINKKIKRRKTKKEDNSINDIIKVIKTEKPVDKRPRTIIIRKKKKTDSVKKILN